MPIKLHTRTIALATMGKITLAFDLYGTLLSTGSIANHLSQQHGRQLADAIATTWRREQLEYTWRMNSMKQYEDFEQLTKKAFLHALAEHGVSMTEKDIDQVLQEYDNLDTFDDVEQVLERLDSASDIECVIFSNGTRKMLQNSINGCKGLSSKSSLFTQLISVDHVRSFKPAPECYRYLRHCVRGSESEGTGQLYLVSSNPFDIVGARTAGLQAVWVDRAGNGWIDKLGQEPSLIVQSLGELLEAVQDE